MGLAQWQRRRGKDSKERKKYFEWNTVKTNYELRITDYELNY
jgi:ribosomal protein L32E